MLTQYTCLPIVNNGSIVEAWKVSNCCDEVLSASEYSLYGTDKEVKDKIVQALIDNHRLEKEKMLLPVVKTWKIFCCIQVADPRFPQRRFTIGKSLREPLITQSTDTIPCFTPYLMTAYIADFANENQVNHSLSIQYIVGFEEEAKLLFN